MVCPKCGYENEDNKVFCVRCGTKLTSTIKTKYSSEEQKDDFDTMITGFAAEDEDDEEEMARFIHYDLKSNPAEHNSYDTDIIEDEFEDVKPKTVSTNKPVKKPVKKPEIKQVQKKPKASKKKIMIIILIVILCTSTSAFITYLIRKSAITDSFNKYFELGNNHYAANEYNEARREFINSKK